MTTTVFQHGGYRHEPYSVPQACVTNIPYHWNTNVNHENIQPVVMPPTPKPAWPVPFPRREQPRPRLPNPQPAPVNTTNANPDVQSSKKKGKKRNKKPRSEIPHGDNSNPVCLDHLKGICAQKRWRCKYAHPPLWLVPKGPEEERHICTVYVLTGTCKYGEKCFGLHPPLEETICQPATAPAVPNTTVKPSSATATALNQDSLRTLEKNLRALSLSTNNKRSTDSDSDDGTSAASNGVSDEASSSTDGQSTPDRRSSSFSSACSSPSQQVGQETSMKRVLGLLNKLTAAHFDSILMQLFQLLTDGSESVSLQQALPLVFGKAIREPLLRPLYARLCNNLHDLVPKEQQHLVADQILEMTNQLLSQEMISMADGNLEMKKRLVGAGEFFGELIQVGLFNTSQLNTKLQYLHACCTQNELAVEVVCSILCCVGTRLAPLAVQEWTHVLSGICAQQHYSMRAQVLVDNVQRKRH
eukprot:TRINITY_DN53103_c0_g1_i1.p1 TRINITY_DN53103_c0_g1~~TRINITY_DN53103_c0_g1_i1.p1  ORF type:complete len:471 (+),score=51.83 TRINITY_DN53103_c0_g1_i1:69-1481(+)